MDQVSGDFLIADKGYDSEAIREYARSKNMIPIIPKRSNNKNPDKDFDLQLYRNRHVIENLFAKLKHYKSIAMRADKLARNFKAVVTFACTFLWLKLHAIKWGHALVKLDKKNIKVFTIMFDFISNPQIIFLY